MKILSTTLLLFLVVLLSLLTPLILSAQEGPAMIWDRAQAQDAVNAVRQQRWEDAKWVRFFAPYYSIEKGHSARLILVSQFQDSVSVSLEARTFDGARTPLDTYVLAARETVVVDLRDALGAREDFGTGTLRLSFFGDRAMVQGWLVLSGSAGVMELPLVDPSTRSQSELASFWDLPRSELSRGARPHVVFHNTGESSATLNVKFGSAKGDWLEEWTEEILPGHTQILDTDRLGARSGKLETRHSADLVAVAFIRGKNTLARIALMSPISKEAVYGSLWLPLGGHHETGALDLVLLSTARRRTLETATISLLDFKTGHVVLEHRVDLPGGAMRVVDLLKLYADHATNSSDSNLASDGMRVSVLSSSGAVLPSLRHQSPSGLTIDTPLFERGTAHSNGMYPLPSLLKHAVVTTIVNLGSEPSKVVGQLEWNGGSYSVGPVEIMPGAGYRFDFKDLGEKQIEDLLGRRAPQAFERAFFQWTANRGSQELIARTEAQPVGSEDRFGFNCFGCCYELPSGGIVPSSIAFDIGQSPTFEGVEFIETCSGTMGPFPIGSPTTMFYSSPLSWNGTTISSTGLTNQTVSFRETGEYMWVSCSTRTRNFLAGGNTTVDKCQKENAPNIDPAKGCFQPENSSSCSSCYSCCDKTRKAGDCRCRGNQPCKNGVQAACGTCKQVCFGHYNVACSVQITSCP